LAPDSPLQQRVRELSVPERWNYAADGDLASVAVGLRIIDATGPLAITTPCGPVH